MEARIDAWRQNNRLDFHAVPKADILDPYEFGRWNPYGSTYQTVPNKGTFANIEIPLRIGFFKNPFCEDSSASLVISLKSLKKKKNLLQVSKK